MFGGDFEGPGADFGLTIALMSWRRGQHYPKGKMSINHFRVNFKLTI